jgi:hypothetical protein
MKLEMAMSMKIGGPKVRIHQEVREERRRAQLAKMWKSIRHELAVGTRKTFVFLLGATVLVVLFAHESEIQHVANARVSRMTASIMRVSESSRLRQNTLNYDKEVEEVAK